MRHEIFSQAAWKQVKNRPEPHYGAKRWFTGENNLGREKDLQAYGKRRESRQSENRRNKRPVARINIGD